MFRTFVFTLILGTFALTGCGQLDARILGTRLSDLPSIAAYPKVVSVDADVTNASGVGAFALPRFTTAQVVPISVHFSGAVDVTGTPTIELETGTVKRKANYVSGSGTSTLVFEYAVVAGDSTSTLDYTSVTALDLNGGTITPSNGATGTLDEVANLTRLPTPGATNSLASTTPILVRTIPEVKEFKTPDTDVYLDGTGLEVVVKYDQPITVTGTPSITVRVGSNNRVANYIAQVSPSELLFRYEIIIGDDDTNGIELPTSITMTGATILNPANEVAVTTLPVKDTTGVLTYTSALTAEFLSSSEMVSESAGDIYIPVQLSAPAPIPFKVSVQTSGEAGDTDFTLMTPEVQFAIGEQSKTIHVKILNDSVAEAEKRIRLVLTKNSLGSGGVRSFHEIHINDDDGAVVPKVVDFQAGDGVWCALFENKELKCWGANDRGQLGDGTSVNTTLPPTTPTLSNVENFSLGGGFAVCAVNTSKELWCWGYDNDGFINGSAGAYIRTPKKVVSSGAAKVKMTATAIYMLNDLNELYAWGRDYSGSFGTGTTSVTLAYASRVKIATDISNFWLRNRGSVVICATKINKDFYCWGQLNAIGKPMGNVTQQLTFPASPVETNVINASATYFSGRICVQKNNAGTIETHCWGDNYYRQLDPANSSTLLTVPTLISTDYKDIAVYDDYTCGLKSADKSVWCWGNKTSLPATEGTGAGPGIAMFIPSGAAKLLPMDYTSKSACVLMESGSVECWGIAMEAEAQMTPLFVQDGVSQVALAPNSLDQHACLVTKAGATQCWGRNVVGQIGDRTNIARVVPTEALSRNQAVVATARNTTCSLSTYGEVRCWGTNIMSGIGLGASATWNTPKVLFAKDVIKISLDEDNGCVVKADGSLWCWGLNTYKQVNPSGNVTSTPVQVKANGVRDVVTQAGSTCFITTSDELFCWGRNTMGALGLGDTTNRTTIPTTPILTNIASVAIGQDGGTASRVCAINKDKEMFCWGNTASNMGTSSTSPPSSPTMTEIEKVSIGNVHMCVIQGAAKQLFCWGANVNGRLGDGTTTQRDFSSMISPIASGVQDVSAGALNTCAIANEKLYCWGNRTDRMLGVANSITLPRSIFGLTN
ncbi:UVB-resistance protein [Bdellovibrio sp. SKB1291214]|uniref:Calx-beta domain-containing protein n=1 Tax=Bdellovibrio sp. SKB1291214 TaxID=1732569 RepID=UPI00223F116D|nr:Calx-beta domain-containing protein [Bdellovibrio sp. SKB1291214]UYL10005.1 UVB-resistance protein [Bdellovibrio sp. SKB1291214]